MPKKSTIAVRRRTHWSRTALAAALIAGGGGALAQSLPPYIVHSDNPALTPVTNLAPRTDGSPEPNAAVPVATSGSPNVIIGGDISIQAMNLADLAAALGTPLPSPLPPGMSGTSPVNLSIALDNTLAVAASFSVAPSAVTSPDCTMLSSGGVNIACTYNPTGGTVTFAPTAAQVTSDEHLIVSGGDTWTLTISYDVPNPTQRHSLRLDFTGSMKVFVTNPLHATPLFNDSINFPSAAQTIQPVYPPAGPLPPINVAAIAAPVRATLGPVANHQPALIAQGHSAGSVPPAGGNSNVTATFQNLGTAPSTSLTYWAIGFPANAAVTNCTYTITPPGTTQNATSCTVNGSGDLTFGIATGTQLAAGASIQINYTVPIPANTPPNPAFYNFTHNLRGSNGILPLPAAAGGGNPVQGVLASGGMVVSPMAYATGGTQSVPALGPLALGSMGLMVALVPGFVARRRRAAARAAQ